MALMSIQLLTEMSTREFPGSKEVPALEVDNLIAICEPIVYSSGLQPGALVPPGVREDISGGRRKYLTSIKMKHRESLNLEPALILALTKCWHALNKLSHLINRSEPH
jgi:hypothetical protein